MPVETVSEALESLLLRVDADDVADMLKEVRGDTAASLTHNTRTTVDMITMDSQPRTHALTPPF